MMKADNDSMQDDNEDVQSLVTQSLVEAVKHFEENIEPDMAEATDYYFGRPFGDEKAGRSQVVSTDLRDATLDQIPELLEIFMGSDSVVEFKPRFKEDVETAAQATDMVNYVFYEDNQGFLIMNSVLKDAGVRRLGYVKWWWEEQGRIRGQSLSGITEEELQFFEEKSLAYEITGTGTDTITVQNPETGESEEQEITTYSCEMSYEEHDGRVRIEEVPPEEIVFTPEARKFSRAPLVAHVRSVPRDELVNMGIEEDFIDDHKGVSSSTSTESLAWTRQHYGSVSSESFGGDTVSEALDASQQRVQYAEAYVLVDTDGDGVGELRMFQCVGPEYVIVPDAAGDTLGALVDEIPIAVFTPDPEPHTIPGLCNFDYLREIQRVKSQIQRGTLNSLAQSIENQMVVTNDVNIKDLISPEISGVIRVRRDVNAIREIKHTFVGGDTLPVLAYYDQIKADRTGRVGPREGMDANVMQSTTAEAVGSTLSKSQQRIRMLARVYAETGFKAMFMGIYRLLIANQRRERMVRLRGKYVPVDPRSWDAGMDVTVNVALGTGSRTEKLQSLMQLSEKQEMHLQMGSPLVSFSELRVTYGKLTDLLGYKDTDAFFKPWGPEQQQAMEQQQQQEAAKAKADPAERIVDVEEIKVMAEVANKQQELALKDKEIMLKDERERDKTAREFALKEYEIELMYGNKIADREMEAKVAMMNPPQPPQGA